MHYDNWLFVFVSCFLPLLLVPITTTMLSISLLSSPLRLLAPTYPFGHPLFAQHIKSRAELNGISFPAAVQTSFMSPSRTPASSHR